MANFNLHVFVADQARERSASHETVLAELRRSVEAISGKPEGLGFDADRGAFTSEVVTDAQLEEVVQRAILERSRQIIGRAEGSALHLAAELGTDVGRGNLALLVVGRRLLQPQPPETLERLGEQVARASRRTSIQVVPTSLPRSLARAEDAVLLIGEVLAACESEYVPSGPYLGSALTQRAAVAEEEISRLCPELREWELSGTTELWLVRVGHYASAYLLDGTLEGCPLGATDERWPSLYRDPQVHLALGNARASLPHFAIRGELVAAVGGSSPCLPLSQLPESFFLQVRTFEDDDAVGAPRVVAAGLRLDSLNRVRPPSQPPPPHREQRTVAMKAITDLGFLSQLLSARKRRSHWFERMHRTETFLQEYLPDIHSDMGLQPGASLEQRTAIAELLGLRELPELVDQLLGWHDGQTGHQGLVNEWFDFHGWTLMSCASIQSILTEEDERHGWRPSFLPLFENGYGDYLAVDTAQGDRLSCWRHDDSEEPVTPANAELSDLTEQFEGWCDYFEQSCWSSLAFDFDQAVLEEIHPAALRWSRVVDLRVGALLLGESSQRAQGMFLASSDAEGVTWLQAFGSTKDEVLASLRKQLRTPLPLPRERTDYEEGLLTSRAVDTITPALFETARRSWFGYVPGRARR
jgi:cell wall assembly regulator SMI1